MIYCLTSLGATRPLLSYGLFLFSVREGIWGYGEQGVTVQEALTAGALAPSSAPAGRLTGAASEGIAELPAG